MTKFYITSQCIYNLNETGITVLETEKILASKGQKGLGSLIS